MPKAVRTAVLPVAGLGTRFLPVTKAVPKEMLPLVDRPCIEYAVAEAVEAGIDTMVFVTARGKTEIEDYFDRVPELERRLEETGKQAKAAELKRIVKQATILAVRQHQARGLGHAVLCARRAVGDVPFAVLLGDDIIDGPEPAIGQLMKVHAETGGAVVALMEVPPDQTNRYGICAGPIDAQGRMKVEQMVEKPLPAVAPSRQAIVGRYVLPPEIWPILETIPRGAGGEFQLTDAIAELCTQGKVTGIPFAGVRFDTGNVLGLLRASIHYALKRDDLAAGMRQILAEYQGR